MPLQGLHADAQRKSSSRGNGSFPPGKHPAGAAGAVSGSRLRWRHGPAPMAVPQSEPPSRLPPPAKKLPKSEPQSTSGAAGRSRGVDLHEQSQQNKSQCCSN